MTMWFVVSATMAVAVAPSANELISKVQDRYNSAKTLSVDFTQEYRILGHARPPETGTLTLRKSGQMRWDYTRPTGKLFISDGKQVFLYTASDNRVEKVPLKDTEDMRAPMAFLLGHLDFKKEFRDFSVRPATDGNWLTATAKTDRLPYEKVDLLIRPDGSVEQMKIFGRDQSVMDFEFRDEKLNPRMPAGEFQFKIPPGATVVDSVEFGAEKD
jgi:outer membrane lipoprotein carrier protein